MEHQLIADKVVKETEIVLQREMTELEKAILLHGLNLYRLEKM